MLNRVLVTVLGLALLMGAACGRIEWPAKEAAPEPVLSIEDVFIAAVEADCLPAGYPTTHRRLIKAMWHKHLPNEWADRHCGFFAGIMAESSGIVDAVSPAGAVGLGQQIPNAANDCRIIGGLSGRRKDARFSVGCSAWLYNRNRKHWPSERTRAGRLDLTRASYITGAGNLIAAQNMAAEDGVVATYFEEMFPYLGRVITPKNAQDTQHYVNRIDHLERRMTPKPLGVHRELF